MILSFDQFWSPYLEDIDIKSYEWPWTADFWAGEVKRNIIKMWMEEDSNEPLLVKGCEKTPRGFIAYRFIKIKDLIDVENWQGEETVVHILKLAVHPNWRNSGIGTKLLEDVEKAAKLQDVNTLVMILHEENDYGRAWLMKHCFASCLLHKKIFPDGRDGYSFFKVIK